MNAALGTARFFLLKHFVFLIRCGCSERGQGGFHLRIGSVADNAILLLRRPCWHPCQYGSFPVLARIRLLTLAFRIKAPADPFAGVSEHPPSFQHQAKGRMGCGFGPVTTEFGAP